MATIVKPGRKPKLNAQQQRDTLERLAAGESQRGIARRYGVSQATIWRVVSSAVESRVTRIN